MPSPNVAALRDVNRLPTLTFKVPAGPIVSDLTVCGPAVTTKLPPPTNMSELDDSVLGFAALSTPPLTVVGPK